MCGIIGFAYLNGEEITDQHVGRIKAVLAAARFRGPDGSGVHRGPNWIVGHNRLAIIDPDAGAQPWVDADSGCALTYNGEIYNHVDLRRQLEAKGRGFRSRCDTEVVMAAYLEWGEACVEKFNGFFSFVVVDPRRELAFAARDRIGIKPFYYGLDRQSFRFGSTVPGVLALSPDTPELDVEAMSHYLSVGKIHFGDRTLLKGIRALDPGCRLTVHLNDGDFKIERYWRRPVVKTADKGDVPFESAASEIRALLEDSVRARLMSDAPLGAFLSGGLDSAIIALVASKDAGAGFPLYCAGTDDDASNEFEHARRVADLIGGDLSEVVVTPATFAQDWGSLIANKGMPLCTPNEISIFRLAAALRKRCAVTLTGEGADEIFGGYVQPHFSAFDFDRCSHDPDASLDASPFGMAMMLLYGRGFFINDTDHYLATSCWFSFLDKVELFKADVWSDIEEDEAVFRFYENFFDQLDGCSTFDKRMHLHADFNLENLLSRVDNSTMAASVEARVPFTDHRVVEAAFRLPDAFKMDWRDAAAKKEGAELTASSIDQRGLLETKRLPRRAFKDTVPREILEREKMSFPVPFEKWFAGPMAANLAELCLESPLTRDVFNREAVESLVAKKHRNLWLLANLCEWWRQVTALKIDKQI